MYITDLGNRALLIQGCIISYPHLFKARAAGRPGNQRGDPKFSAAFILPADMDASDNALLATVEQDAIAQLWPNGPPAGYMSPWKDGSKAAPQFAGRLMISASSTQDRPPDVFSQHARMAATEQSQIFGGCIVDAHVRCYPFSSGNQGVTFGLNGVRLVDNINVSRLDGGKSSAEVFGIQDGFPAPTAPPPAQPGPQVPAHQQVQPPAAPAPQVQPQPGQMPATPSFLD